MGEACGVLVEEFFDLFGLGFRDLVVLFFVALVEFKVVFG